jgi:diguanylate cyclase (GGDEF)-like protein
VLLGRWIVRGVAPDWDHLVETVPVFQEASIAGTAVLGATLWRIDPLLEIYLVAPVAILHRLLSFRDVEVAARTDDKTGLYNYRYFEECAQREVGRARRTGAPLSLLVLDMDRLRDVNNTYGHQSGDRALIHVAHVLSRNARRYDVVCRFGGEEFLVLLPATPLGVAAEVAERLRQEVRGTPVLLAGRPVSVSVSIGVAEFEPSAGDLERLLADADARVYAAKRAGRDRVVAGSLPV